MALRTTVYTLNPLVFPKDSGFRRDASWISSEAPEEDIPGYDYKTLAYDVFFSEAEKKIILFCPKLFNFKKIATRGVFESNAGKCRIKSIKERGKYCEIRLAGPFARPPKILSFKFEDIHITSGVSLQDIDSFNGLRCLLAISRNNSLEWIFDWARHHVEKQGVEAVVLMDNASTKYGINELEDVFGRIPGLKKTAIIPCPFNYGPKKFQKARFLQVALMNLVRTRFFGRAAGVLSVDVDELVFTGGRKNVFELADSSLLNFCTFAGEWLYARDKKPDSPLHADHLYRARRENCTFKKRKILKKFCVLPYRQFGINWWQVHGSPYKTNKIAFTRKAWYFHFRNISTKSRSFLREDLLEYDPQLENLLSHLKRRQ